MSDEPPRPRPRRTADVGRLYEALERETAARAKVITATVGLKLALLPAGRYRRGTPEGGRDNERPAREVDLSAFYIGVAPVTRGQFRAVTGADPAFFSAENGGGDEAPVESVSWHEAAEFCRLLSARPEERAAGRAYRLPTEAEWEYACRAGGDGDFAAGAELLPADALFAADLAAPPDRPSPAGGRRANAFGLFDLHGNVWEWCADWYRADAYRDAAARNPTGPAAGTMRVLRGGSYRSSAATCRSAYRNAMPPHHRDRFTGFRVAADAR